MQRQFSSSDYFQNSENDLIKATLTDFNSTQDPISMSINESYTNNSPEFLSKAKRFLVHSTSIEKINKSKSMKKRNVNKKNSLDLKGNQSLQLYTNTPLKSKNFKGIVRKRSVNKTTQIRENSSNSIKNDFKSTSLVHTHDTRSQSSGIRRTIPEFRITRKRDIQKNDISKLKLQNCLEKLQLPKIKDYRSKSMTIKRASFQLNPLINKDCPNLQGGLSPDKNAFYIKENIKEKKNHSSLKANKDRTIVKYKMFEFNKENPTNNAALNVIQNDISKGFFLKLYHNKASPKLDSDTKY